jgi:signal transduction histidine kinase
LSPHLPLSMLDPVARTSPLPHCIAPLGNRLSFTTASVWALAVALLMSTQYLVQPFVWTYWSIDEVLQGWIEVAWDRLLVAVPIGLAVAAATRLKGHPLIARAVGIAAAILIGAGIGEAAMLIFGSPGVRSGTTAVVGSLMQWSGVALCAFGTYYLWNRHFETEAAARAIALARASNEAMAVETRLRSLRQQIEPHFLFNTLATVRRLQEIDSSEGAALLHHLVEYLQSTTSSAGRLTKVGDEVKLVESYLGIVAIRMRGRLKVEIRVPADLRQYACPPLVVATLVENAVKHGVTPCPDPTKIAVVARTHAGTLELRVEDTGIGMSSATETFGGTGIGLANIRAQLSAVYGRVASLTIERNEPRGVRAIVLLPRAFSES